MPEIKPDRGDASRCISVHWTLPVQCVLPRGHRENWHETWSPETGNRLRYRYAVHATQELRDAEWHDLQILPPGDICGEPRPGKPTVHCQAPRTHNAASWTHHAVVDGCTHTWNTVRRALTAEQERQDMVAFRRRVAEQDAEITRLTAKLADESAVNKHLVEKHTATLAATDEWMDEREQLLADNLRLTNELGILRKMVAEHITAATAIGDKADAQSAAASLAEQLDIHGIGLAAEYAAQAASDGHPDCDGIHRTGDGYADCDGRPI